MTIKEMHFHEQCKTCQLKLATLNLTLVEKAVLSTRDNPIRGLLLTTILSIDSFKQA